MSTHVMSLDALHKSLEDLVLEPGAPSIPIELVTSADDLSGIGEREARWVEARGWKPSQGSVLLVPGENGEIEKVLFGTGGDDWAQDAPMLIGALPDALPAGDYRFSSTLSNPDLAVLGFLKGCYRFTRYKSGGESDVRRLVLPEGADRTHILALAEGVYLGRNLINTPANDLGPADLEAVARDIANSSGATIKVTEGSSLLADNFPMIHAVGRASDRSPRLIDLRWGAESAPRVTVVGKGICFDTGGLNLKPGNAMSLMKKDMGGAAAALAFAVMVMRTKLPIRLRVLIPAADNSVAGNAFRPGDVLQSRNGMTVEIGNTDAEGRLVLADALSLADEEAPDYLVTFATLTGAARVALGPDLPPFYSTDEAFAEGMLKSSHAVGDPVWRMPFWAPYDKLLKSNIADVNHISEGPFAGSVTAALFLKRFVEHAKRYAHLDIYGWVPRQQPGRPRGGEPHAARALYEYLRGELGA
ncbi:MAG: leucyl aminopeptidase family protein [Methyloceanibacter sp.]|nr:leucyl aminopeptidase family protein [Methyloceanibacter sp.]